VKENSGVILALLFFPARSTFTPAAKNNFSENMYWICGDREIRAVGAELDLSPNRRPASY